MAVRLVVFDVGETLIDETRLWGEWADWLGISRLTFFAALGAVIEKGQHHREVFNLVRPGIDFTQTRQERENQGWRSSILADDLYPDALPCIAALRSRGYRVGIAGNQKAKTEDELRALGIDADFIGSSENWSVEKPAQEFFHQIVRVSGLAPQEIAYVGDRLDNDVLPASQAGMVGIFLRRGPWGVVHAAKPEVRFAKLRVETLRELPNVLELI
jgi:HAD superfamily hydrolase (TIGR01549 family)